jgi:hypothetical protein
MRVREATPGDILIARGKVIRQYHSNFSPKELATLKESGFSTGFLMPAWVGDPPLEAWPCNRDHSRMTTLLYVGPIRLRETVGGLKKYHIFLDGGNRVGLEGYEFRHLELA